VLFFFAFLRIIIGMEGFKRYCTATLTALALLLIRGYQRWLSPYKGYSCAYRLHVGGHEGCSGYGLKVIRRYGIVTGYTLLQRRLWRCGQVAEMQREQRLPTPRVMRAQAGDCDLGGCDLGGSSFDGCDSFGLPDDCDSCDVFEFLSELWPESEDKKKPQRKWRVMAKAEAGHCDFPNVDCDLKALGCAGDVLSSFASLGSGSCGSSRHPSGKPMKYKPLPKRI
jgi:putative component of membrane protein insertase Oxa1/YidC/SpoIIIJ protein YidD